MKPARVEIAAPGAQGVAVIRAPFAVEPESKRVSKIENQEISLKDELIILEDGTKARNREFYRQLDAISERGRNWEQKLALEIKAQRKAQKELASFFEVTLADAVQHERKALFDTIENFHNEVIPPQDRRMADNEKEVEVFVSETVPDIIDRQSGIVSRKLKKAHDTFDIENAKVMKREEKIISRYQRHVERTAQAFEDERATRRGKFMLIEEEMCDAERQDDRQEEKFIKMVTDEMLVIKARLKEESEAREKEDNTLLDTMLFAQQRLQEAILHSFGAEAEDIDLSNPTEAELMAAQA